MRTVLLIVIDILVVIGLLLLARLFVVFFKPLAISPIATPLVSFTEPLVLPLKLTRVATPFQGFFEFNTAVTVLIILVVDYLLATVRRNT